MAMSNPAPSPTKNLGVSENAPAGKLNATLALKCVAPETITRRTVMIIPIQSARVMVAMESMRR